MLTSWFSILIWSLSLIKKPYNCDQDKIFDTNFSRCTLLVTPSVNGGWWRERYLRAWITMGSKKFQCRIQILSFVKRFHDTITVRRGNILGKVHGFWEGHKIVDNVTTKWKISCFFLKTWTLIISGTIPFSKRLWHHCVNLLERLWSEPSQDPKVALGEIVIDFYGHLLTATAALTFGPAWPWLLALLACMPSIAVYILAQ